MEIFDSYAYHTHILDNQHLKKLAQNMKLKLTFNTIRLQGGNSNVCGHYCIAYIILRCKGYSPLSFNGFFSHTNFRGNDARVKRCVGEIIQRSKKSRNACYRR